jgi:putative oxidoreductase
MHAMISNTVNPQPKARTSIHVANIALWVLQLLMAALFFWHGQFSVFPPTDMVAMINENIGEGLRVFIGVAEILAAIGLILPGLTRILPWLTALAAAGLMIVMSCASVFHLVRGETASAISAFVIFLLVSVIAYTRWKVAPITARRFARA